jgi:hypothetical protein
MAVVAVAVAATAAGSIAIDVVAASVGLRPVAVAVGPVAIDVAAAAAVSAFATFEQPVLRAACATTATAATATSTTPAATSAARTFALRATFATEPWTRVALGAGCRTRCARGACVGHSAARIGRGAGREVAGHRAFRADRHSRCCDRVFRLRPLRMRSAIAIAVTIVSASAAA